MAIIGNKSMAQKVDLRRSTGSLDTTETVSNNRLTDALDLASVPKIVRKVAEPRLADQDQDVHAVGALVPVQPLINRDVEALNLIVPVPGPLLDTAQRANDVFMQIQKVEPDTELQITRMPKKDIVLYNAYKGSDGQTKGHYFDLKAKQHAQLKDTFHLVKQHCTEKGLIPADATSFTINFREMQIRYYDPSGRNTCRLSLKKIMEDNPDVKASVDKAVELIDTKINKGPITGKVAEHAKGAADGASPCHRSNSVLAGLPKSTGAEPYKEALEIARPVLADNLKTDAAIHRMGKAETIIKKVKDKIDQQKQELSVSLPTVTDPAEQNKIRKKVRELEAVEQQLNELDTFAIYSALAFYPDGVNPRLEQVSQRATVLKQYMNFQLEQKRQQAIEDGTTRKWIPQWMPGINKLRTMPEIEKSDQYCVDAAGLMFSGLDFLDAQSGYNDHCRTHHVHSKKDGLEDAILREVLRPDSLSRHENPVLEQLFDGISDETLREELVQELNTASQQANAAPLPALTGENASARVDDYRRQAAL